MKHYPDRRRAYSGFTLVELAIIVTSISALVLLASPVFSRANVPAKSMICQNNMRQLMAGWALYSADNHDKVCQTGGMDILCVDPSNAQFQTGGPNANWVLGSMESKPGNTDERFIRNGLLFKYVGDVRIYKCPADPRTEEFPANTGKPTLRSYSMSCWLNPKNFWSANSGSVWNFRRQAEISRPAMTFVLTEENPGSINDGWFICDPTLQTTWIDLPAAYHNGGAAFSFSDGHVEPKKWSDTAVVNPGGPWTPSKNVSDLRWLQSRSTY